MSSSVYSVVLVFGENAALYALASIVFSRVLRRLSGLELSFSLGGLMGLIAVVGMLEPIEVAPGVVFDARSVPVAAAGLFGGPVSGAVAAALPGLYRIHLGGGGVVPGLINLGFAALIGISLRLAARRTRREVEFQDVVYAALLLPIATFVALLFLPNFETTLKVASIIGLPYSLFVPPAFVVLGFLFLDESSRRRLLEELASRQQLMDSIHAGLPAMLWQRRLGPDGQPVFSFMSESAQRLLGRTPAELMADPQKLISAIHPDDRDAFLAHVRTAEETGVMPDHEYRAVHPDGTVRWLRVNASGQRDGDGMRFSGVTVDITQLKAAEQHQRQLAQMVQNCSAAFLQLDTNFNIEYLNAAAEALYGHPAADLIGGPSARLRPPERVDSMAVYIEHLQQTRQPGSTRTEALHRTGRRIPIQIDTAPLFDAKNELCGWVAVVYNISEQVNAERELERQASTDPLTGAANRRRFTDVAAQEVSRARRYHRAISLILLDLDHFKRINDTHGHHGGDVVLRETARIVQHVLRDSGDMLARLGGEEFAVLLPDTDADSAVMLADRLRECIATPVIDLDGRPIRVTSSFGVTEWHSGEADLTAALNRADQALYAAKAAGRNCVKRLDPPELTLIPGTPARPGRASQSRHDDLTE